jgi:hypothetical protein
VASCAVFDVYVRKLLRSDCAFASAFCSCLKILDDAILWTIDAVLNLSAQHVCRAGSLLMKHWQGELKRRPDFQYRKVFDHLRNGFPHADS